MPQDSSHTDAPPPPTYQESITSAQNTGVSGYHPPPDASAPPPHQPPQFPSRPPQPTPLPSSSSSFHSMPSQADSLNSDLYTSNPSLPFQFPKGHFCQKCKNTGFKVKNGDVCSNCWSRFFPNTAVYQPNPSLPLKFPPGFICTKCKNTGYKHNKKTCKSCWELFLPRNSSVLHTQSLSIPLYNPRPYGISPFMQAPALIVPPVMLVPMPMGQRVPPGDPRLGGVLCGRCRGLGLTHFFLDEEICKVCNGLGRIVNQPPQGPYPPQAPYPSPAPYPSQVPYPPGPLSGYPPPQSMQYNDSKH